VKLACPRCDAHYTLPDDRIPAGTPMRFTCKRCGEIIHLRPDGTTAAAAPAPPAATPPPPPAVGEWFVLVDRQPTGPFDVATLRTMLSRAELSESSQVWREGMPGWQTLVHVEALRGLLPFGPAARPVDAARTVRMGSEELSAQLAQLKGTASPSPFDASAAAESATAPGGGEYAIRPPGEATKVFMVTAGLYARKRRQRIWAGVGIGFVLVLATLISLDVAGLLTLPGMGVVYDATGIVDPNVDRAVARVESKLQAADLPPENRETLRRKLVGLQSRRDVSLPGEHRRRVAQRPGAPAEGEAAPTPDRDLTADVFADDHKREAGLFLGGVADLQVPSLPAGLSREAIFKVAAGHGHSMTLCFDDAVKRGEKPAGKLELELTIAPDGAVKDARVLTRALAGSALASCALRRVQSWHFPRFDGEPVAVVFPYVLSTGR
jgi:hypothetical protein